MFPHAGTHFTPAELAAIRDRQDLVEYPTETRLIYHLGARCPTCWAALRELAPPDAELAPTDVAVVLALRRLTAPPDAVLELDACHRASVVEAGDRVLGFCFLLLEELRKVAASPPRGGIDYLRFCDAAVSGNGVLLLYVPEAHDLYARCLTLVAGGLCGARKWQQAREALELAKFHLDRGTGRAEPRAGCLEAEAALACAEQRRDRGWALLEDAAALLEDHQPADRRAETLLRLGNTMVAYSPATRVQAHGIYQEALAILDRLAPGTNPLLRLSLTHQLARLLLDLDLEKRINRVPNGSNARTAAAELLRGSEALYRRYATPEIRGQRAAFLGIVHLDVDRSSAMAALREATASFSGAGAVDSAVDLMLRLLLLGAVEGQVVDPNMGPVGICHEIWQLPEQQAFYREVLGRLGALLLGKGLRGGPPETLQGIEAELIKLRFKAGFIDG